MMALAVMVNYHRDATCLTQALPQSASRPTGRRSAIVGLKHPGGLRAAAHSPRVNMLWHSMAWMRTTHERELHFFTHACATPTAWPGTMWHTCNELADAAVEGQQPPGTAHAHKQHRRRRGAHLQLRRMGEACCAAGMGKRGSSWTFHGLRLLPRAQGCNWLSGLQVTSSHENLDRTVTTAAAGW